MFTSYDLNLDGVSATEIEEIKNEIKRDINVAKSKEPTVYDYYVWLYNKLSDVIKSPEIEPGLFFTKQMLALVELAGLELE